MSTNLGEGFLALIEAEPTLLPEAPPNIDGRMIHMRAHYKHTSCLRCGRDANVALASMPEVGPNRWLDICFECYNWLLDQIAQAKFRDSRTPMEN